MSFEMLDVTISQIVNEDDQAEYLLYTEWASKSFKIMLFKSPEILLMGEMSENDIDYYSEEHSKSRDEYLEEIKNALSGKDAGIHYFMQDDKFEWRRNKKWILGKITVRPILDIVFLTKTVYDLLKRQRHLQEAFAHSKKENESLVNTKKELYSDIEEMIKIKSNMEKELYQKFILILNAKKKKIRELEDLLKNKGNGQKTIFDESTDQSEDSDVKQESISNKSYTKKRSFKYISDESTDQSEDSDVDNKFVCIPSKQQKSIINSNSENVMKEIASISKETHPSILNNERCRSKASTISSDESECELNLKIPESSSLSKLNGSNLEFEEEIEQDLFV